MKAQLLLAAVAVCFLPSSITLSAQGKTKNQKYYMDVHRLEPGSVSYTDVAGAHEMDLKTQDKYGVKFIKYWVDEKNGVVYCLSKAGDADHVHGTHEEAHGLIPAEIYEVIAGEQESYTGNGFLFLDIHDLGPGNVSPAAVAEAHKKDLQAQGAYNVNFINYWVDEKSGKIFCLSEAPSAEAVINCHKNAHGLAPTEVVTVTQGQ